MTYIPMSPWVCPNKIRQFMSKVFVDTGWFKGLIDRGDQYHLPAKNIYREFRRAKQALITTNFVVAETFTLVHKDCGLYWAKKLDEMLKNLKSNLEIERVTTVDEGGVWKWFWYDWRELSYTDCTSFGVMERLGLKKVATFDEHFELAGFERVEL